MLSPTVIPSLAEGISDGHWVDLEQFFATGRGVLPSSTCQFQLDEDKGSRRDFLLACPIALAAATACSVFTRPLVHSSFLLFLQSLHTLLGMLLLKGLRFILPFGLLAGLIALIAIGLLSRMKFEIFGMFTFVRLVLYLWRFDHTFFRLCNSSDVDSSWLLWSREAEASLARAYLAAGGPPLSNPASYVGRGSLSICTMRLGGRWWAVS